MNWQSFGYDALGNQTLSIQDDVTTSSTYDGDLLAVQVVTGAFGPHAQLAELQLR